MIDAPDRIHELIKSTPHKDITDSLQKTIDNATLKGKPQIEGVNKLGRGMIRLRAATKEGAKTIKDASIGWEDAYPGLKVYKPKSPVVIHGVPTEAISWDPDTCTETKDELQKQNAKSNTIITSIRPLRTARKQHKPTAHQSIIVYTEDAEATDRCIQNGFLIDRQILKTERYTPHLHIMQCYKCYRYRHRASNCRNKEKCDKCAEEHPTTECTFDLDTSKCVNCDGAHEAWHIDCPTRTTEGKRLAQLQMETSPFYTE